MGSLWRHRRLALSLAERDVQARYRGSFGGGLWTFLHPLLTMLIYYFVFGVVLQARFPGDPSREGFVLYFLAGMLPWLAISEALGRSPLVVVEHASFIKKLIFPSEILPLIRVLAALASQFFALVIFLLLLGVTRGGVPWTVVWVPVLLIPQVVLTLGLSYLLAATGTFLKDLAQLTGFLLTLWFFLTPICYPDTSLPAGLLPILAVNPLYALVRSYRAILVEGRLPEWAPLLQIYAIAALILALGWYWFNKLRKSFADVL